MQSAIRQWSFRDSVKRIIVIAGTAAVGVALVSVSNASLFHSGAEAEGGVVTPGAQAFDDATASGGRAILFNGGTTGPQACAALSGLQFCDDFDGAANTPPDATKWRILTGSSWGGQCFRNARENITHDGQGHLVQTLIDKGTMQCTDGEGFPTNVTSGGMDTQGKKHFKYGRFEIRAKLACAKSVWGAIWTATGSGPAWPQSGEIDFYELFNDRQHVLKHTIHAGNPYWNSGREYTYTKPLCQDFHVYGGEWREGYIQFMLDGQPTHRFSKTVEGAGKVWPFDSYDQRLIIDLQYGSPGWPHAGTPDLAELPASMLIDYVRVYE